MLREFDGGTLSGTNENRVFAPGVVMHALYGYHSYRRVSEGIPPIFPVPVVQVSEFTCPEGRPNIPGVFFPLDEAVTQAVEIGSPRFAESIVRTFGEDQLELSALSVGADSTRLLEATGCGRGATAPGRGS